MATIRRIGSFVRSSKRCCFHVPVHSRVRKYSSEASSDALLRRIFDENETWSDFSRNSSKASEVTGLFGNKFLDSPRGLRDFSERSLMIAQKLTGEIIGSVDPADLHNAVRKFDILSDVICKVIDMAAFVRMAHPDSAFVAESQRSHELMYDFMNMLNTSVELYKVLDLVFKDENVVAGLSDEEKTVGQILLRDFERSGVNLDPAAREEFVKLSSQISVSGQNFLNNTGPSVDSVKLKQNEVYGLEPRLANQLKKLTGSYNIPTYGPVSDFAMRTIQKEEARKKIWLAQRSCTDDQIERLREFLQARAKLAKMLGHESFAAYELQDKMAKTPANVENFLSGIANKTRPLAMKELSELLVLKRETSKKGETDVLQAWDRDYFSARYMQARQTKSRNSEFLSSYFSLGTVMQGLSRLFTKMYGVSFVPSETGIGEVWDSEVRKLDIVSDTDGKIGVMYCDLFQRPGKSPHPAHFTVQCSREVSPAEPDFELAETVVKMKDGNCYQLPIIVLVCDFAKNALNNQRCLLSFSEVETLFHEMGHALHSMLGRTKLHNVSGTRCATDFVELPSVLMESFAREPKVLRLFARHHETNQPLPMKALHAHLNLQSFLDHCETYHQFMLSKLDQVLHSGLANSSSFNTDDIYYNLESQLGLFPAERSSRWYGQFGHLFGYGATYYCYLFDRAIAEKIWNQVFKADPLSRDAGEKFKSEVLAWGGSRNPWECIAGVLDEPVLASGDENAMLEIGKSIYG